MKKLLSVKYSAGAFNAAMLFLRIAVGTLMLVHGYDKLIHFKEWAPGFKATFIGLSPTISFTLLVFAEFFCAALIILGLFTRLAAIPLIIAMIVAVVKGHNKDLFGEGEHAALFAITFVVILLLGPGRISIDGMINK
ncbi:MAG: DoxX family protein [Ferruginibacter sp.]